MKAAELQSIFDNINSLRRESGASVTILSDDEDADVVAEQCAVEVCGGWTNWMTHRFTGRTIAMALDNAADAMRAAKR